ncbi:TPA: GTP-binding protein, partial [Staphylococcus aureus]|nr:GTP-binding protein [Staphylococcus aureus]HCZ7733307.1 GTP-binding protein [Staphylococcus aureus]
NEFGKMSVDGALVSEDIPLSELTEGCICCAMKADVSEQLHQLYLKEQPDIVFIECSGIAEPVSVLDACLTPILAPFTTITHMIGVIDASMYKHIKSFPKDIQGLFYEQLAYCSVLFVNKIDSADVETTSKLLKDLEVINPEADIQVGMHGSVTLPISVRQMTATSDNKHKSLHQMINHQFVQSPVKCTKAQFIKRLACLPSHIYRLKGFMTFEDTAHTYLIQFTQGQYELTPVAFSKKVPEYLVLIGKGISKEDYQCLEQ